MGSQDSRTDEAEPSRLRSRAPSDLAVAGPGGEVAVGLELAAAFDALRGCALVIGADDRVISCRCACASALAIPAGSAPGRPLGEVLPPIPDGRLASAVARARSTGTPATVDYAAADGRERFEARLAPLDGGRLAVVVLEATGRLDAVEALRRSEERLRAIIETEPECVKVLGPGGELLEMNPSGLAMLEASSLAEAASKPIDQYVSPPFRPAFQALAERVMQGDTGRLEFEIVGLRGTRRWLETSAAPLRNARGGVPGLLAVTRDITARKQAEQSLVESEERFRALIEKSSDLLLVVDAQGRITFASPAVSATLGPLEALEDDPLSRIHPGSHRGFVKALSELRERPGASRSLELRALRGDGSWGRFEVTLRSLVDVPAVRGLIINARDVTEQRLLQEELAQAQKLESIGQLAGGVAHDFNNLLVAILGNAEFLETALGPGHPCQSEVHDIRLAGQRARELTSQLLAVARRQIIAPRIVNLNDVVREAEKLLRRVIGEDVAIDVRLDAELGPTRADVGQLQQVLLNLAVNARDAMPKGGRLTIETRNVEVAARPTLDAPPDLHVLLRVSDTGEGMSEDVQRHVFEPFFTTKAPGKGTGLGLATVYGVVKQSGGRITFRSKPNAGTTFEILLPRAVGTASPVALEPEPAPRRGTETVLVVEDEAVARDVTVRALREAGYRVLVAIDARQAVTVFGEASGPVDLLLTDVVMPGGSGKDVAEVLRRSQPALRVLYMSGYTQDAIVHQGVLDSEVAFLPKPFTPSGLLAKIGEVLDGPAPR